MKHTVTMLALVVAVGLSGCATNKDLDSVRALAQQANTTADAALKAAYDANNTAAEAKSIAQAANATAQNANETAQDAKTTSLTTENKIDRMFKKAMYK